MQETLNDKIKNISVVNEFNIKKYVIYNII